MNIYPEQLNQIVTYIHFLNLAEKDFQENDLPGAGLTIGLKVDVVEEDGVVIGRLVDEVGGAWSFEAAS